MKKLWMLVLLTGCMVGPDPEDPGICMPESYDEAPQQTEEIDLAHFWNQFDDPLLNDFVDEALTCNLEFQIALRRIEEVRAQYRIESSLLYPQIQGNFLAIRAKRSENLTTDVIESPDSVTEIVPDLGGPLVQNFFQLGFDAAWEIDLWGKNRRRSQAAHFDFQATQDEALDVQIALVSDVARAYVDIRTLQGQIATQVEQISRNQSLLELAESRFEAGLTSYLDVTRAKAALDAQVAVLPPLQESVKRATYGLAVLLGKQPQGFSVEEGEIPSAAGRIPTDLPSDLLCRRPDLRQAEADLHAATARIGQAKAELFPTFSLMGTLGTQAGKFDNLFVWPSRYWTIGPTMIWNLFTGGRLTGQIKVANERQKQALLAYEQAILNALADVEGQLVGYFKEQERLNALGERIEADRLTRNLTLDQYIAGLVSFDNVLDTEATLFLAQLNLIESKGTLMVQLIGLYKALGGGWQCYPSP